jgi:hypothetical protein
VGVSGPLDQGDIGEQLADFANRLLEMENRQQTFMEVVSDYISDLYGQVSDYVFALIGDTLADYVMAIPIIGPVIAPFVRSFVKAAPRIVMRPYSGYNL